MQQAQTVRRALYVLFARLLSGPPDAALFERLRDHGLRDLARLQGIDLTSDLVDEEDAESSAAELAAEYEDVTGGTSLRASDYGPQQTGDPVASIGAFLTEHRLELDASAGLPLDHLSVLLGIMGALWQADEDGDKDAAGRARVFFLRHLAPWWQAALTDLSTAAGRQFYRGVSAMLAAFLASEARFYASE